MKITTTAIVRAKHVASFTHEEYIEERLVHACRNCRSSKSGKINSQTEMLIMEDERKTQDVRLKKIEVKEWKNPTTAGHQL